MGDEKGRPTKTRNTTEPAHRYPQSQKAYENMMRHDAYHKVKGRVRQTKWADEK
ncbi:hypothetical protein [Ferroacidibacillus organovorans]|uniref:hypothetical protein n=1 Tax=Ferroacidibacillus organovorans TaxID=1765683 RepID=UPI0012E7CC43|nr:hypothetical protein [Ferroacidibacillus organovorans]